MRLGPFYSYRGTGLFWFRIWNKGLSFRDKTSPNFYEIFSERIGKTKFQDIGKYRIKFLK